MSRRDAKRTGTFKLRIALASAIPAVIGCAVIAIVMGPDNQQQWLFGILVSLVVGAVVGITAWTQAGGVASRISDLRHATSKLGRGAEVRVRVSGNDEITGLGRDLQYLATDLAAIHEELEQGGGAAASMDPQVRELRDSTLEDDVAQAEGFEVDGLIGAGDRGGLDYYGSIARGDGAACVYVVSAEGSGALSVHACRMARDEIVRALEKGVNARKALSHTNRVLHGKMPRGACAKAVMIDLEDGRAKLYQAGYRTPLWICSAGEVLEISADGLALGLDAGPVFEKGLRSEVINLQPGERLVQTNDAGVRMQDLLDLVRDHSPKHTAPFMNLVIGGLEGDAGSDGLREDVLLVTVKRSA